MVYLQKYDNWILPFIPSFFLSFLGLVFIANDNVFLGILFLLGIPLSFFLLFERREIYFDEKKQIVVESYIKHKKRHIVKIIPLDEIKKVLLISRVIWQSGARQIRRDSSGFPENHKNYYLTLLLKNNEYLDIVSFNSTYFQNNKNEVTSYGEKMAELLKKDFEILI